MHISDRLKMTKLSMLQSNTGVEENNGNVDINPFNSVGIKKLQTH